MITAIAVVAIVIAAAYFVLSSPKNTQNPPGPEPTPIDMDTISAQWEELDLIDQPPAAGKQILWVKVRITNLLEEPFLIVSYEFSAEGGDGTRCVATEDDSQGTIDPGDQATFTMSIQVPLAWAPKQMVYEYSGGEVTSTISTPSPLVHDLAFSGVSSSLNSTDYNNQSYSTQQVLHVSLSLKNQWTKKVVTAGIYFTAYDAGGAHYDNHFKSGPDELQPGVTGSFDLEFLVPLSFNPDRIEFDMPVGPYGSVLI